MRANENEASPVFSASPGRCVAIIGGGLAGLSLSILLAKAGYKVMLFEKEKYPFHKVCGEYISMESRNFFEELGMPLGKMNLPVISKLIVSSPNGTTLNSRLDTGGFGISRYLLDSELCGIAQSAGVEIFTETKVDDVSFETNTFSIHTSSFIYKADVVAGTFGKRSNLDIKWSRAFIKQKASKLNNYIGVKYHIRTTFLPDTIALHNFENGYCGISKIEDDKYCLCYLTTAKNLQSSNHSISEMEKNILQKNPLLKEVFSKATFLYASPLTISQISFSKKNQVANHVLMIGDAAGMITPLCGNGMSMALHAAKIAFTQIDLFLKNEVTRQQMEDRYTAQWKKNFAGRLRAGRFIQSLFGKPWLTDIFIRTLKYLPGVTRRLIASTHGKSF